MCPGYKTEAPKLLQAFDQKTSLMSMKKPSRFRIGCLLVLYIQSLRQQGYHQQLQSGMVSVQLEGRLCRRGTGRPGSMWVQAWFSEELRQQLGHFSTFITRELCAKDVNAFQNYLRMPLELFHEILKRITPAMHRIIINLVHYGRLNAYLTLIKYSIMQHLSRSTMSARTKRILREINAILSGNYFL